MKVGLQLYTIRDLLAKNVEQVMERVSSFGYEGVQFAGFYDQSSEEILRLLKMYSLHPAGSHVDLELLSKEKIQETMEYHHTIGNRLLIVPYVEENERKTKDDYKRLAEKLNIAGEQVQREGFSLAYHNHDFEFSKVEGKLPLDLLTEETVPDYVSFELDAYWAKYAGFDPISIMLKLGSRLKSLHVKDIAKKEGKTVSTVIGNGEIDWLKFASYAAKLEVEWLIVEQEHFEKDPLVETEENYLRLHSILKEMRSAQ
ncbi:sugar phosphate isomerase/epimerase [Bacillus gobiensis]|uniref:sugar phosphate isomerase/epimerase family protein n=1 Tax=Bacillus gobiensis TaxID=1441095 RepID=UPI003D1958D0